MTTTLPLVPGQPKDFGLSVTLEKLGIRDEIEKTGRYDALRPKMFAMDRATQGKEIRSIMLQTMKKYLLLKETLTVIIRLSIKDIPLLDDLRLYQKIP